MGSFILREKPGKKIVENLYKWWSCKFKKSGLNELNKPPMLISIPGLASHPSFQKWHRSHVFVGWWTSKPLKTLGEKTKKKNMCHPSSIYIYILTLSWRTIGLFDHWRIHVWYISCWPYWMVEGCLCCSLTLVFLLLQKAEVCPWDGKNPSFRSIGKVGMLPQTANMKLQQL